MIILKEVSALELGCLIIILARNFGQSLQASVVSYLCTVLKKGGMSSSPSLKVEEAEDSPSSSLLFTKLGVLQLPSCSSVANTTLL